MLMTFQWVLDVSVEGHWSLGTSAFSVEPVELEPKEAGGGKCKMANCIDYLRAFVPLIHSVDEDAEDDYVSGERYVKKHM